MKKEGKFFVITGGPGTGKTSVIKKLKKKNLTCIGEYSRQFIRKELARGGNRLPWKDSVNFDKEIMKGRIGQFKRASKKICFFDRGIPDGLAYTLNAGVMPPKDAWKTTKKYEYEKIVFFFPQWKKIFVNDKERKESFRESKKISRILKKVYRKLGYRIVVVPKKTIDERVEFILDRIK